MAEAIEVYISFDSGTSFESSLVTPMGSGLYRLEESPARSEVASLGDIIKAEQDDVGRLRFRHVVSSAEFRTYRWSLPRHTVESKEFKAFCDKVIQAGGMWERVLEGAKSLGDQVAAEKVYISDLDLKFCQGDLSCRETGQCIVRDDMAALLEKINQADGLILGSPLYRGYIAGQMKVFMDRTAPFEKAVNAEQMRAGRGMRVAMGLLARMIPTKLRIKMMQKMAGGARHLYRLEKTDSVVVVVGAHPSYIPQMERDLEQAARELGSFSLMSGGEVVASILADSVAEGGDVANRPGLLGQAFEAGKQLALSCTETRR